jgi:hypothetical protein
MAITTRELWLLQGLLWRDFVLRTFFFACRCLCTAARREWTHCGSKHKQTDGGDSLYEQQQQQQQQQL